MALVVPRIISTGTAVPPHVLRQKDAQDFAVRRFGQFFPEEIEQLTEVFDHALIQTRYICMPMDWFDEEKSFSEKNDLYIRMAVELSANASRVALERAGWTPSQVTHIIFLSSSGLATPSIDARLIGLLGMRPETRRTPIWGLGCAGGAAGISHAYHAALGDPKSRILVVATDLCSLTFNFQDFSKSNLVATALFGDGAGATCIAGDEVDQAGLEIRAAGSFLWPDSLDVMGWNIMNAGMQVVFAKTIPDIVARNSHENIGNFLEPFGLTIEDLSYFVAHPGGVKVLKAYEESLRLPPETLNLSREILRDFGNMSSSTVLFVLDRFLAKESLKSPAHGLITALGPGFSAENILFET